MAKKSREWVDIGVNVRYCYYMNKTPFTPNPFAAENARLAELRLTAKELAAESPVRLDSTYVRNVAQGIYFDQADRLQNHYMGAYHAQNAGDITLAAALNRVRN